MRQSTQRQRKLAISVLAALAAAPLTARAEDAPDLLTDPFRAALGSFIMESDTTVRVDGDTGRGTPVDWDRKFGDGDATRFRVEGHWRFAERHRARVMWFSTDRSNTRNFEEEIEWNGEVFPIGARVKGEFGFDVYQVAYDYSFLKRDNYELTVGIGLHFTAVSAGLSARITDEEGGTEDRSIGSDGDVDLPLPVLAVSGTWGLPHNFWISGQAQLFALEIDAYDGTLQDLTLAVTWQPKTWLGIGVGYNYFGVDVDVDKSSFKGNMDWVYDGPMIFYNASF